LDSLPGRTIPLAPQQLKQYWVIQHVTAQQAEMYRSKRRRCDDRIVSLHQPHVRPIIRGKANQAVEFGAELSLSLTGNGLARVDRIHWDAFHEGADLKHQVEAYKARYGVYPESVHADPVYGTRENGAFLKDKGIRYAGKPLGRPRQVIEQTPHNGNARSNKGKPTIGNAIPIEDKFGQGKRGYSLNTLRAKTARTSEAWIHSIFRVMNLLVLVRHFLGPEIILGRVAELVGLMRRIRQNSHSPGLKACSISPLQQRQGSQIGDM
jgi:IS5 family transposase